MSRQNYHTTDFFTEFSLAIEMRKTQILINKPVYLELSILELHKILMYDFWYDYVNQNIIIRAKLCYMGILYTKIDDIHKDTSEAVGERLDTSNYELDRPLPKWKNKKVIVLM